MMDIIHRLHYLVLSQKSDLMTMDREQRMRVRRQSSLPDYSKANRTRQRLEQAYFNDVSASLLCYPNHLPNNIPACCWDPFPAKSS